MHDAAQAGRLAGCAPGAAAGRRARGRTSFALPCRMATRLTTASQSPSVRSSALSSCTSASAHVDAGQEAHAVAVRGAPRRHDHADAAAAVAGAHQPLAQRTADEAGAAEHDDAGRQRAHRVLRDAGVSALFTAVPCRAARRPCRAVRWPGPGAPSTTAAAAAVPGAPPAGISGGATVTVNGAASEAAPATDVNTAPEAATSTAAGVTATAATATVAADGGVRPAARRRPWRWTAPS